MQDDPRYDDVVAEVRDHLVTRAEAARTAGVPEVWIDPGIGFGKDMQHNLTLLAHLDAFVATGHPVMVGVSRKGFIGQLTGRAEGLDRPAPVDDRLDGSVALAAWAATLGARMVRAHDVAPTVDALRLACGELAA
jgi:dihydropteroate synthase